MARNGHIDIFCGWLALFSEKVTYTVTWGVPKIKLISQFARWFAQSDPLYDEFWPDTINHG